MYNPLPLRGPGGSEDFQVGVEGAVGIVTMTPIEGKGHSFCRLCECESQEGAPACVKVEDQKVYFSPKKERFAKGGEQEGYWTCGGMAV